MFRNPVPGLKARIQEAELNSNWRSWCDSFRQLAKLCYDPWWYTDALRELGAIVRRLIGSPVSGYLKSLSPEDRDDIIIAAALRADTVVRWWDPKGQQGERERKTLAYAVTEAARKALEDRGMSTRSRDKTKVYFAAPPRAADSQHEPDLEDNPQLVSTDWIPGENLTVEVARQLYHDRWRELPKAWQCIHECLGEQEAFDLLISANLTYAEVVARANASDLKRNANTAAVCRARKMFIGWLRDLLADGATGDEGEGGTSHA
jgi:hypothetical protein